MPQKAITFLPQPQTVTWLAGCYLPKHPGALAAVFPAELEVLHAVRPAIRAVKRTRQADIAFQQTAALRAEAYSIQIQESGIVIDYNTASGAFYALCTLQQILLQCPSTLPCCHIQDAPGLSIRGVMLDISRDKIPTLTTLLHLVDLLASFKINHFELYIEGFSFAYPSFSSFWAEETPITGDEIRQLDAYCKARFIDLTPNQNCLGHMAPWLQKEEYRPLAEHPSGMEILGRNFPPATLNPLHPGSLDLIQKMTDDLLPNFSSQNFHVNLDEPFGLGSGNSQPVAEKIGVGRLYLDYVQKIHQMAKKSNKKMMMWGDILAKHPELIAQLPKDILVVEWGYEAEHPFAQRAEMLRDAKQPFCVCPGTSSWTSFTGITDAMLQNVKAAADSAYQYGAQGMLIADWGDSGHMQALPVSYAAYLYAAAFAWNRVGIGEPVLAHALDTFIFRDSSGQMGQFCLDAGRYSRLEEFRLPNKTLAVLPLLLGILDKDAYESTLGMLLFAWSSMMIDSVAAVYQASYEGRGTMDSAAIQAYLAELSARLAQIDIQCPDADLIRQEYTTALQMVAFLEEIRAMICNDSLNRDTATVLLPRLDTLLAKHRDLWLSRNKAGGFARSSQGWTRLRAQLADLLR